MQNVERETNVYPGWIKNNINIINSINNSSIIIIIIVIIIIIIINSYIIISSNLCY